MEKVMNVNGLVNSLQKITIRRTWDVFVNDKKIGTVSADTMSDAMYAVVQKYPYAKVKLLREGCY